LRQKVSGAPLVAPHILEGKIINIPGVGNLDLSKRDINTLLDLNKQRIRPKLETKTGDSNLPFPKSKTGFEQAWPK
jgi:hypothetical protein